MTKSTIVLCVDDEEVGLMIRRLLLESEGYSVLTAESGSKALQVFSFEQIDLVVLDYLMPRMNGDEAAKEMKRLKPAVPIIMLSAYADLEGKTLVSVDKYITKNEPAPVLLSAISELLNVARTGHSDATSENKQ